MSGAATREFSVRDAHVRVINQRNLLRIDWILPVFVLALAIIGWITLYSASRSGQDDYYQRQILFFFMGITLALLVVIIDYRFLIWLAPLLYLVMVGMLLAVEFYGSVAGGSARWLRLGTINFQPSELSKVVMIYTLTWYLTLVGDRIRKLRWFLLTFVIVAVPMGLILKQPNIGTAAALGPLVFAMLFIAGCRWWHGLMLILLGLCVVPVIWLQMQDFDPGWDRDQRAAHDADLAAYELKYYQKERIYTFLNPELDPRGSAWQTIQSMITVGSGGLSGKGFLQGTQTRLNYVPEHHTDFIFSLYAEERGFFGVAVVLGLYVAFLLRGLQFARDCPEMHGTLLATGAVVILAFHIFVNIAITVGMLPVTGIPLPFLSYGGSFYLTTMLLVGILLNVPMRRRTFIYE
ncbi:MAG: rod shape-determining protein RodA [Candidatus Hydrogenedentota bacterium]